MQDRVLQVPQYDVEIWSWRNSFQYVADISNIIVDGLNFSWVLNDVESLDFSIDLIQFEKKCAQMGVKPAEVLTPYVHDIRLRRNGKYILGCQIVEANISISNNTPPTIQVRCTGFLNLFKDRYLSYPIGGKSAADISCELIRKSQLNPYPAGLIKNPTGDIDTSYWLATSGVLSQAGTEAYSGSGGFKNNQSTNVYNTNGTQLFVKAGTHVQVSCEVKGMENATFKIIERKYMSDGGASDIIHLDTNLGILGDIIYQTFTTNFITAYDNPYLVLQQINSSQSIYNTLYFDEVFVSPHQTYDSSLRVSAINHASPGTYQSRTYELQNVKDAIIGLANCKDADFEFYFTPDRVFISVDRVGSNKYDIEASYPGNIESMNITRSATNLTNRIFEIGSGIGNDRVEYHASNGESGSKYGYRDSVITNNNATLYDTLVQEAEGQIRDRKDPTDLPKMVIRDGSINPGNVQIGDTIMVLINNGDEYLTTINGAYRIMEYQVSVDLENVETVTLTLEKQ